MAYSKDAFVNFSELDLDFILGDFTESECDFSSSDWSKHGQENIRGKLGQTTMLHNKNPSINKTWVHPTHMKFQYLTTRSRINQYPFKALQYTHQYINLLLGKFQGIYFAINKTAKLLILVCIPSKESETLVENVPKHDFSVPYYALTK